MQKTDSPPFSPCNGIEYGGQNESLHFIVNAKYADPNYKPVNASEAQACRLVPGKKYYLNYRWLRKSDIVDTSGKLRTTGANPIFSGIINSLKTKTSSDLNKYMEETFNLQGDSCLPGKHPWQ